MRTILEKSKKEETGMLHARAILNLVDPEVEYRATGQPYKKKAKSVAGWDFKLGFSKKYRAARATASA